MNEKISIIMTSYNYAGYISEAIESVINQTYANWELIIVDDASTDNSTDIIKHYQSVDERIKLFVHEQNLGLAGALQTALKYASADWIAFLESDDIFMPNSIEEKVKAIATGADIIFTDVEMFQDETRIIDFQRYFDDLNKLFVKLDHSRFIEDFSKIIPKINIIPTFSVVMLKRELLSGCDFNSLCKASLDYYLWSQLTEYKLYYINKKLTKWRIHSDSYITKDRYGWCKKYIFSVKLYYNTIKHKNPVLRLLLLLNYMRARLIYLKISKEKIKLNIANNKFIVEKIFSESH